jgi:hypothetical protein
MPFESGTLYKVGEVFGVGYEEADCDDSANRDNSTESSDGNAEFDPNLGQEQQQDEEEEEDDPCIVCFTDERDVIFLPCRHRAVCSDCFAHMDTCPACRADVREVVRVLPAETTAAAAAAATGTPGNQVDEAR